MIPLLDLEALHSPIAGELRDACEAVIASGDYILGPNVLELEREIADYCGAREAVGVASGTDAIHLALRAAGIGTGDEVITTAFTFCATADSILLTGARPVFADIDPSSFNIDPAAVEESVSGATKAIIAVHLYGLPADMEALRSIADSHDLYLIEDNAQALGSSRGGRMTGSLGDVAALSFFPSKNLGCFGDGGMVVTNDEGIAERVRVLRVHGASRKYYSTELGLNSRLDEIQAAFLRVKLPYLDHWNERRRENAGIYGSLLRGKTDIRLPVEPPDTKHAYHQYTIRVPDRDNVREHLSEAGIASAVYYPVPLNRQPLFAAYAGKANFQESERASAEVLSLPAGPELGELDITAIANSVIEAVGS